MTTQLIKHNHRPDDVIHYPKHLSIPFKLLLDRAK